MYRDKKLVSCQSTHFLEKVYGTFKLFGKQNTQEFLCEEPVQFEANPYRMVRKGKQHLKDSCKGNDKVESMQVCGLYANTDIRLYDHDTPPTTGDEAYTKSYLKVTIKKDIKDDKCIDIPSLEKKVDTEYVLAERPNGGNLNRKISSLATHKGILIVCIVI